MTRRCFLSAITVLTLFLSSAWANNTANKTDPDADLLLQYRTIVKLEHDSRHLYHLQSQALIAVHGGWVTPVTKEGSELDSLSGVPRQIVQADLNQLKARIRRGEFSPEFASQLQPIILDLEEAIALCLLVADLLKSGQDLQANEVYRTRSLPLFEKIWRQTYTLTRDTERRF